jgi:adenosylcobyric acid synthase
VKTLMVQGTASSVGKSLLVTALCRIYARRGLRVAPFKSQNMSLNAAVTPDGLEIGRAQLAQAEAARVTPSVDMNPILLKPETASSSQVVVMGRAAGSVDFRDYHRQKPELRQIIGAALDRLRAAHDLVVIEGAGSPAEVNLRDRDLVNMWVAERADAPVLLVTDIERGGALAAVVGTLELLEPRERARVRAIVVNKFRGDPSLFNDGVRFLEARSGLPVAGVVTHLPDSGVASEDSLNLRQNDTVRSFVACVQLPHLSNFDEFEPLGGAVRWCRRPDELEGARLVVLPGSKCTVEDLAWLRATGLAGAIVERARAGGAVLGICGGYQMLGERILDPDRVESPQAETPGLDLLPVVTRFLRDKITARVKLRLAEGMPGLFAAGGQTLDGYEIHCGRVEVAPGNRPFGWRGTAEEGAVRGSVCGTLTHGLFENPSLRAALLGETPVHMDPYDRVADHFEAALSMDLIDRIAGVAG